MMSKGEPGSDRDLGADNTVTAEKIFLPAEHVHRTALAVRIAAAAAGQFGHDPVRIHATSQHVPVIAIRSDDRVTLFKGRLHADHDRLLPDVQVAKSADQAHAIHLTGPLLESPD